MNITEARIATRNATITKLLEVFPGAVQFSDSEVAVPTTLEVDGTVINSYIGIATGTKNHKPTKTAPAFVLADKVAAWQAEKVEKAERAAEKAAEKAAKEAERAAKKAKAE